jgi:ribosome biogenesis GTPase
MRARVISLDRGLPMLRTEAGEELRAQQAVALIKSADERAVVGDVVNVEQAEGQEYAQITEIHPREHVLARRSMVESRHEGAGKHDEQVLAANVNYVLVLCALSSKRLDADYLLRQLVMAHDSGASVAVVLTKTDQAHHLSEDKALAVAAAKGTEVLMFSAVTGEGLESVRALLKPDTVSVLLGRSGVGKSTLINKLLGSEVLPTGSVRSKDSAGRHTTVARKMLALSNGAYIIDAPGLRSIGLYDAHYGLATTFPDIEELAAQCRYRDCTHTAEPGCAVVAAQQAGDLNSARLDCYRELAREVDM